MPSLWLRRHSFIDSLYIPSVREFRFHQVQDELQSVLAEVCQAVPKDLVGEVLSFLVVPLPLCQRLVPLRVVLLPILTLLVPLHPPPTARGISMGMERGVSAI